MPSRDRAGCSKYGFPRTALAAVVAAVCCAGFSRSVSAYSFAGPTYDPVSGCVPDDQLIQYQRGLGGDADGVVIELQTAVAPNASSPLVALYGPQFSVSNNVGQPLAIGFALEPSASVSDSLFMSVSRAIGLDDDDFSDSFGIAYGTYDAAVSNLSSNANFTVYARIFMTRDFTWMETRRGPSGLAPTMVTPLFHGYGDRIHGDLESRLDAYVVAETADPSRCIPLTIAEFKYADLQQNIQARYSRAPPYPFKEHGHSATALTIALQGFYGL